MAKKAKKGPRFSSEGKQPTKAELRKAAVDACKDKTGRVTPQAVVQAAHDKDNILHGEFEWNDTKAAMIQRENRARELIRECREIRVYGERKLIFPVYISDNRTVDAGYVRTVAVAKNAAHKALALNAEVARIRSSIQRAVSLAIVFDLEASFERMLDQVVEIEVKLGGVVDDEGDFAQA